MMNPREARGNVAALVPIFFRWLQTRPPAAELAVFESCKKACCGMSYLLDVTGFRCAYPVLAAVFASASWGASMMTLRMFLV